MANQETVRAAINAAQVGWHTTAHARTQARTKGFNVYDLLAAAGSPTITYAHGPAHPGQYRHIRGDIVAVVDPRNHSIITAYVNVERTPLRADQLVTA